MKFEVQGSQIKKKIINGPGVTNDKCRSIHDSLSYNTLGFKKLVLKYG